MTFRTTSPWLSALAAVTILAAAPAGLAAAAGELEITGPTDRALIARQLELLTAAGGFGDATFHEWHHAAEFRPSSNLFQTSYYGEFDYLVGEGCFWTVVDLPAGSLLETLRLYFDDASAAEDLAFGLCRTWTSAAGGQPGALPGEDCDTYAAATSGEPGYGAVELPVGETILPRFDADGDGADDDVTWLTWVCYPAADELSGELAFKGVRAEWRRQVSPAPLTASFADVPPGHPFFPFVEALAAAGVTAGCSADPPLYCPDKSLTRGEMAVFLSAALGLHWAPAP